MSTRSSFRIAGLVAAGLCFVAAIEAWMTGVVSGSIAARGAGLLAALAGLLLGASVFLPRLVTRPLERLGIGRVWRELTAGDAAVEGGQGEQSFKGLAITLVVWGATCFAANVFGNALAPPPVEMDDQGAYLKTARQIQRDEGPFYTALSFLGSLRDGRFREANRHPLFLAVLALRATVEWGRLAAFLFGAAAFGSGVWMVWRRFSPLTAGLFALLLGLNHNLGEYSVMVVCESLLIWLVALAYFAVLPAPNAGRHLGR